MNTPRDTQGIFGEIYRTNKWRGKDSISGPGSNLAATAAIREALPLVIRALDVATMLDAPCGDLHWISTVELELDKYIGVDVVPEVVSRGREVHSGTSDFLVADLTKDPLPRADLVFCRDCLVHLADALALDTLRNMKASGASYLMATTFYALDKNLPGSTGGWRPINMQRPPFSFPPPILIVPERSYSPTVRYSDKAMGVWSFRDLDLPPSEQFLD
jgi:hypothetical protein